MNKYEEALNATEEQEDEILTDAEKAAIVIYVALKEYNNSFIAKASVNSKLSTVKAVSYNRLDSYLKDAYKEIEKLQIDITKFDKYLRNVADINFKATADELADILQGKSISINKSEYDDLINTLFKNDSIRNNIARAKSTLRSEVKQAISSEEGITKLNKRVKGVVEKTTEHNKTIIRTQTTKTMNNSRHTAMQKANDKIDGEIGKKWVSRRDEKVRVSHKALDNGVAIKLDRTFDNGLMYPGDSAGESSEVINCRCELEHGMMS